MWLHEPTCKAGVMAPLVGWLLRLTICIPAMNRRPKAPILAPRICGCEGVIGVTLEPTADGFVLHPLPDQAFQQAGVLDGDLLIQVDETLITTTLALRMSWDW